MWQDWVVELRDSLQEVILDLLLEQQNRKFRKISKPTKSSRKIIHKQSLMNGKAIKEHYFPKEISMMRIVKPKMLMIFVKSEFGRGD